MIWLDEDAGFDLKSFFVCDVAVVLDGEADGSSQHQRAYSPLGLCSEAGPLSLWASKVKDAESAQALYWSWKCNETIK